MRSSSPLPISGIQGSGEGKKGDLTGPHAAQNPGGRAGCSTCGQDVVHQEDRAVLQGSGRTRNRMKRLLDVSPTFLALQGHLRPTPLYPDQGVEEWEPRCAGEVPSQQVSLIVPSMSLSLGRGGYRDHQGPGRTRRAGNEPLHPLGHEPCQLRPAIILEGVDQGIGRRGQDATPASPGQLRRPVHALGARAGRMGACPSGSVTARASGVARRTEKGATPLAHPLAPRRQG